MSHDVYIVRPHILRKDVDTEREQVAVAAVDGTRQTQSSKEGKRWRQGYGGPGSRWALALLLMATPLAGIAYAKIISGTPGNDYLLGTIKKDLIRGRGGDDYLRALAGDDLLSGGAGDDEIYPGEGPDIVLAGAGNDKIYARDTGSLDSIDCGGGFDKVETIHRDDRTLDNCERTPGPRRGNI